MKKTILSLVLIAVASLVIIGATSAWLLDTETSSVNTVTGGTLNLTVNDKEGSAVEHVTFDKVVPSVQWQAPEPGTNGYTKQWVIKNVGNLPGKLTYSIKNIKNFENDSCLTPEKVMGDVTCGTGDDQGELGSQFKLNFSLNQSPWGYSQDVYPVSAVSFTPVAYHLNPNESKAVYLRSWWINAANNNLAQGDSLEFDIEFKLEQE